MKIILPCDYCQKLTEVYVRHLKSVLKLLELDQVELAEHSLVETIDKLVKLGHDVEETK